MWAAGGRFEPGIDAPKGVLILGAVANLLVSQTLFSAPLQKAIGPRFLIGLKFGHGLGTRIVIKRV